MSKMEIASKENNHINTASADIPASASPGKALPRRKKQRTSLDSIGSDDSNRVIVFTPNSSGSKPCLDFSFDEELTPPVPENILQEKRQRLTPVVSAVKKSLSYHHSTNNLSDSDDDASTVCNEYDMQEGDEDGTVSLEAFQKLMRQAKNEANGLNSSSARKSKTNRRRTSSNTSLSSIGTVDSSDSSKAGNSRRNTASPSLLKKMLDMDSDDGESDTDEIKRAAERGRSQAKNLISEVENVITTEQIKSQQLYSETISPVISATSTISAPIPIKSALKNGRAGPTPLKSCLSARKPKSGKMSVKKKVAFGSPKAAEFDLKDPVKGGMTPLARHEAKKRFKMDGSTFHPPGYCSANKYYEDDTRNEDEETAMNSCILATWEEEDEDQESTSPHSRKSSGRKSSSRRNSGIFRRGSSLPSLTPDEDGDCNPRCAGNNPHMEENLQSRFDQMADGVNAVNTNTRDLNRTVELDTLKTLVANESLDEASDTDDNGDDENKTVQLGSLRDLIGNSPTANTSPIADSDSVASKKSKNQYIHRESPAKKPKEGSNIGEDQTVELGTLGELANRSPAASVSSTRTGNNDNDDSLISTTDGDDDHTVELGTLAELAKEENTSQDQTVELGTLAELAREDLDRVSEMSSPDDEDVHRNHNDRTVDTLTMQNLMNDDDDDDHTVNTITMKKLVNEEDPSPNDRTVDSITMQNLINDNEEEDDIDDEDDNPNDRTADTITMLKLVGDEDETRRISTGSTSTNRTVDLATLAALVQDTPESKHKSAASVEDHTVEVGTLNDLVNNSARGSETKIGRKSIDNQYDDRTVELGTLGDLATTGSDREETASIYSGKKVGTSSTKKSKSSPKFRRRRSKSERQSIEFTCFDHKDTGKSEDRTVELGQLSDLASSPIPKDIPTPLRRSARLSARKSQLQREDQTIELGNLSELADTDTSSMSYTSAKMNSSKISFVHQDEGKVMNTLHLSFSSGSTMNTSSNTPKPRFTSADAGNALDNFLGVDTPGSSSSSARRKSTASSVAMYSQGENSILERCRERVRNILTPGSIGSAASPLHAQFERKSVMERRLSLLSVGTGTQRVGNIEREHSGKYMTSMVDDNEPNEREESGGNIAGIDDGDEQNHTTEERVEANEASTLPGKGAIEESEGHMVGIEMDVSKGDQDKHIAESCIVVNESHPKSDITVSEEEVPEQLNKTDVVNEDDDIEMTDNAEELITEESMDNMLIEKFEQHLDELKQDIANLQTEAKELHRVINLNIGLMEQQVVLDNYKVSVNMLENHAKMVEEDILSLKVRREAMSRDELKIQMTRQTRLELEELASKIQICHKMQSWRLTRVTASAIIFSLHGVNQHIKVRLAPTTDKFLICGVEQFQEGDSNDELSGLDEDDILMKKTFNDLVEQQIDVTLAKNNIRGMLVGKPVEAIKDLITMLELEIGRLKDVWEEVVAIGEQKPVEIAIHSDGNKSLLTLSLLLLNGNKSFAAKCDYVVNISQYPFSLGCCETSFSVQTCLAVPSSNEYSTIMTFVNDTLKQHVDGTKTGYSLLTRQFENTLSMITKA